MKCLLDTRERDILIQAQTRETTIEFARKCKAPRHGRCCDGLAHLKGRFSNGQT